MPHHFQEMGIERFVLFLLLLAFAPSHLPATIFKVVSLTYFQCQL